MTSGILAFVPAIASPVAAIPVTAGMILLLSGLIQGHLRAVRFGAAGMYVGIVVAALGDALLPALLLGTVGTVVAWDSADTTIVLEKQLKSVSPDTQRVLLLRAGTTGGVASLTGVMGYLIAGFTLVRPTAVVVVLLGGTLVVVVALVRSGVSGLLDGRNG